MPPQYHDCAQYGETYDRLKLGIPTSSNFKKIVTPILRGKSKEWDSYKYQLIAERLLDYRVQTYTSQAMERGLIEEESAVLWYENDQGVDTRKIGFVTNWDGKIGCSPDRLVDPTGLLEIKAPDNPAQQVEYHLKKTALRRFWSQLQGQLLVTEPDREWVDILAWYPKSLPKKVLRVVRDEPFLKILESRLHQFLEEVEEGTEKMKTGDYVHVPEAKESLRAALQAALKTEITP